MEKPKQRLGKPAQLEPKLALTAPGTRKGETTNRPKKLGGAMQLPREIPPVGR